MFTRANALKFLSSSRIKQKDEESVSRIGATSEEKPKQKKILSSRRNALTTEIDSERSYDELMLILAKTIKIEALHGFAIWRYAPFIIDFKKREDGSDPIEHVTKALHSSIGDNLLKKDPYHYAIVCFKLAELMMSMHNSGELPKNYYIEAISYLERAHDIFAKFRDKKLTEHVIMNMVNCKFSIVNIYLMLTKHEESNKEDIDNYWQKIINHTKIAVESGKDIPELRCKLQDYNQLLLKELPANTIFLEEWEDYQKEIIEKMPMFLLKALSRCSSSSGERAVLAAKKEELSGVELGKATSSANNCWHKGEHIAARDAYFNIVISNLKEYEIYDDLLDFINWICSVKNNLVEQEIVEAKKLLAKHISFAKTIEEKTFDPEKSLSR
jgi:hypothetical protein